MSSATTDQKCVGARRVALYARYSSDLQREASIEDQLRICRERAAHEGWEVVQTFSDGATSGGTTLRPGYQALLAALRTGRIDCVLAESLDRFSRDLEHIVAFHKQCVFHQVRIVTLAEGEVSELHVGLKGTMGALYLKDLAAKTRRGLEGRVLAGRCVGMPPYGYTVVRRLDASGEIDRGLRSIDPTQAAIVRRIFQAYGNGTSPRRICGMLNAEGIPGPAGGPWYDSSIRGRAARHDGLLRNELYIGRIVWRRSVNARDPISGSRLRHIAPPGSEVVKLVPELRIIDDVLWQRVQDRLARESAPAEYGAKIAEEFAFWDKRRPRHLLSGKVFCGGCGRPFSALGKDYLGCRAAKNGSCDNRRTIPRARLQAHVLDLLTTQLMLPDALEAFISAFNEESRRLAVEAETQAASRRQERASLQRRVGNLVEAVSDGRGSPAILAKLHELETRLEQLGVAEEAEGPILALHPGLAAEYAKNVNQLTASLGQGDDAEALEAARALIRQVIIHPPANEGDRPGVELVGELVALLKAGGADQPQGGRALSVRELTLGKFVANGLPGDTKWADLHCSRAQRNKLQGDDTVA